MGTYKVKEVARMAHVTVRTLHHYDAIGLLVPAARSSAGYRLYRDADLLRLQQILLYRELGLSLETIRKVMDDPGFEPRKALLEQREQLLAHQRRTDAMIRSVDAALRIMEGEETMDPKDLFYQREAEERWGDTDAYEESMRRTRSYDPDDWAKLKAESADILERLAAKMREGVPADDPAVRALADEHRLHIDRWFYPCSVQMHAGLAEMYVGDPRFTATFDAVEEGLAAYLRAAIIRRGDSSSSD